MSSIVRDLIFQRAIHMLKLRIIVAIKAKIDVSAYMALYYLKEFNHFSRGQHIPRLSVKGKLSKFGIKGLVLCVFENDCDRQTLIASQNFSLAEEVFFYPGPVDLSFRN